MIRIPAQATSGWGRSSSSRSVEPSTRLRDIIPPFAAIGVLTLAHIAYGGVQPIAVFSLAALFTAIAGASLIAAGPRYVTSGMIAVAVILAIYAFSGIAGPAHRAAAPLAVVFAAGALWMIGYIAARQRQVLDVMWAVLIWAAIAYCFLMFALNAARVPSGQRFIMDAFETPANASILFGLFAVIGLSKILHVVKQMDAEALARHTMIDRLLSRGLSGILLFGISLTCLTLTGSLSGFILTLAVLLLLMWWDTLTISTREYRGLPMRLAAMTTPLIVLGLIGWAASLAWFNGETGQTLGATDALPTAQRLGAYLSAWLNSPAFGHGLGSIEAEGAKAMTLFNAKAMLVAGEARNAPVTWLVETGIIGSSLLLLVLGAMHFRIFTALKARRAPRTFLRLAVAATVLLLLHGFTDSSLDLPSAVWLYALLLGAACGVATGRRIEPRAAKQ
ncbi:MAG TPA: hypothetical protein PK050_07445 [Hyphomonadaceae bacterium]|nr:hypothetical protein [Hyphomonadaceae bacterium]